MQQILTDYARPSPAYCWWGDAFTTEQLDYLQSLAKSATSDGTVGGNVELHNIRRSQVRWLKNTEDHNWVFQQLAHVVSSLNAEHYGFDLRGFGEQAQLTHYDSSQRGMYDWHVDSMSQGPCRKLSLVLQLSDPARYEGGNLELMTSGEPDRVEKRRGLITVFPSHVLHRVTPVTEGDRQSLVLWVTGPNFR